MGAKVWVGMVSVWMDVFILRIFGITFNNKQNEKNNSK
jgi:hypothetical protein